MSVRALHGELHAVRLLVAGGLAEVKGATGDPGQFWIRSACVRLAAVDDALIEAAGVLSTPVRVAAGSLITFGAVTLAAALARLAGLGSAGALVAAGLVMVALLVTVPAAERRLWVTLGRRRLRIAPGDLQAGAGLPDGLIVVPDSLERARVRLVSAALRHAGTRRWTVPELRLAARDDPVVRRLAHADLLLCQAIDCLERYLDDLAKGWP